MQEPVISLDDPQVLTAKIDAYLDGAAGLTGLELYYELERSTSLLTFHTMLRDGPRNRAHSGLQQSYGDHNRLLMLGLDRLVEGDLDWYRTRIDPDDPVDDDALRRCFDAVAALGLSREQLVALWLAAALHDCGMLCGRGAYVDVEDGVVLSRPIIDALCPAELRDLATFVLHHHDYIKGVFRGEVPTALVADDLATLPIEQRAVALAALGCVQVAGRPASVKDDWERSGSGSSTGASTAPRSTTRAPTTRLERLRRLRTGRDHDDRRPLPRGRRSARVAAGRSRPGARRARVAAVGAGGGVVGIGR